MQTCLIVTFTHTLPLLFTLIMTVLRSSLKCHYREHQYNNKTKTDHNQYMHTFTVRAVNRRLLLFNRRSDQLNKCNNLPNMTITIGDYMILCLLIKLLYNRRKQNSLQKST